MDTKKELDELLKKNMKFRNDELPELNPAYQNELRKKVQGRKAVLRDGAVNRFLQWLNIDIKLYQAAMATCLVAVLVLIIKPVGTVSQNKGTSTIIAYTTVTHNSNSFKQDSFLVRNFSFTLN